MMKCKDIRSYLILKTDNELTLDENIIKHIDNCDKCQKYYNTIIKTKQLLSERKEYDYKSVNESLVDIRNEINSIEIKNNNERFYTLFYKNKKRTVGLISIFILAALFIPIKDTSLVKAIGVMWKSRININKKSLIVVEGQHKVDISKQYPKSYELIQEEKGLIEETAKIENKKEAYEKIDLIVKEYDIKLWKRDRLNPYISVTNSKLYNSLQEFNKQTEFKDIPSFIPESFKFSWAGYVCNNNEYEKLVVKYYDNDDTNRINNIGKELWLIYSRSADEDIQKEGVAQEIQYQKKSVMQQGTKLKNINIDKYDGYISTNNFSSEEGYFQIAVNLFMDDYSFAISTLSNEDDINKNEEMIIKIAKSIVYNTEY